MIVCVPTYKRFDLCVQMIESALQGTVKPEHIYILDNGAGEFDTYLNTHTIDLPKECMIIRAQYNMGVARGWNTLLRAVMFTKPDSYAVVVNDDILFKDDTLELFQLYENIQRADREYTDDEMSEVGKATIFCGAGIDAPNAFSMFMVHPKTFFETLGPFDETLYPAYYDDNDMHYRMKLVGMDLYRIPNCGAIHQESGSATLKAYTEDEKARHDHEFRRNQKYYTLKWGGLPSEEKYKAAFNGADLMSTMIRLYQEFGF